MAKQKPKKSIFHNIFIKAALLLFLIYVLVSFFKIQMQVNEKKQQLNDLNEKITVQKQKNEELSDLLENGINDEYIAKIARGYGYGLENERVYESNQKLG